MIVLAVAALFFATVVLLGHVIVVGWSLLRDREAPPLAILMEIGEIGGTVLLTVLGSYWLVHRRFPHFGFSEGFTTTAVLAAAAWATGTWLTWKKVPDASQQARRSRIGQTIGFVLAICIGIGMPQP